MSYTFKYYPDPGITYDIIRMLYVKLNASSIWKETLTTIDSQEEHVRFIEEHASLLPEPDPDLSLFFYIPTNKKTTFLSTLADELICKDFQTYSIDNLINYTNNITNVKEGIFNYYFSDKILGSADFEYQLRSSRTIPDRIKLLLFGFSYNPEAYIAKLNKTIINYYEIIGAQSLMESFRLDELEKFVNITFKNKSIGSSKFKNISYSLCRCTPVFNLVYYNEEHPFFISAPKTIRTAISDNVSFTNSKLLQLIHSIDDQYRLDIIRIIRMSSGISPLEISQKLNLSLTATKYHLSILKKANLIQCRRINRNTQYVYNPSGFKIITKALDVFEKGDFDS